MAQSWLARAFESLKAALVLPPPSNQIDTVTKFVAGRPVSIEDFDPKKYVDEGYRRNVIVYCCINEIAQSVAVPRYYLRDKKTRDEVLEHPLMDVFSRPAPGSSWYDLMERVLIHQQTIGTGYIHKGRAGAGQIVQLTPVRPERVQPVPDEQGTILHYEYKIDGGDTQIIKTEDLLGMRLPDPMNDFHGLSPLMVCGIFGDIDTAAAMYIRDFFANGALPMGLLKFKTPVVRREDRLRVQMEWEATYGAGSGGIDPKRGGRWHNVGVIGADVEYQAIASEPKQLALDSVWGMSETRICATFGVPPAIVQARIGLQYSTYSNQREARRSFWTETLIPVYRRLADGITAGIVAEVDESLEFEFDLDSVPELQEDQNERATRAVALYQGGVASINEAREMAELEALKVDYLWTPTSGKVVKREDMDSGKVIEDAEAAAQRDHDLKAAALAAKPVPGEEPPVKGKPPGKRPPPGSEEEQSEGLPPFELLGLGTMPDGVEREIQRATTTLQRGFDAAVHNAVLMSDAEELRAALADGDWRRAERAIATDAFVKRFAFELERHLRAEAETAMALHTTHLAPRERR